VVVFKLSHYSPSVDISRAERQTTQSAVKRREMVC
jgi:hypothetical protein